MQIVYQEQKVVIDWMIYKGVSTEAEDFSRTDKFAVFLVGGSLPHVIPVMGSDDLNGLYNATITAEGKVHIEIDTASIPVGVYSLRAVWIKNKDRNIPNFAEKRNLFAVTDNANESTNPDASSIYFGITSHVHSYGYDGLSAYELAVLRGKTALSEDEWLATKGYEPDGSTIMLNSSSKLKVGDEISDKLSCMAVLDEILKYGSTAENYKRYLIEDANGDLNKTGLYLNDQMYETPCAKGKIYVIDGLGYIYNGTSCVLIGDGNGTDYYYEYGTPAVALEYNSTTTKSTGGSATVKSLNYSQKCVKKFYDGSPDVPCEDVTSGGVVSYSVAEGTGITVNPTTGESIWGDNPYVKARTATVRATVSLHGMIGTADVELTQSAATKSITYYYGEIDASADEFSTKTFADLNPTAATCNKGSATGDKAVDTTHTIFYVLIPSAGAALTKFQFTSGGIVSDILGTDGFNVVHDNISVDDNEYKVYAYRAAGTTPTDPLAFTYAIEF